MNGHQPIYIGREEKCCWPFRLPKKKYTFIEKNRHRQLCKVMLKSVHPKTLTSYFHWLLHSTSNSSSSFRLMCVNHLPFGHISLFHQLFVPPFQKEDATISNNMRHIFPGGLFIFFFYLIVGIVCVIDYYDDSSSKR